MAGREISKSFTSPVFLTTGLVLLVVLYIRLTRGIDLTDEMQYYGQISGLLESGRLFSNDLFIQQSVYILFYPLFYVYHLVFDFEGLVFLGRLLMSAISISLFLYLYRKLLNLDISKTVASLTSFSLVFAVPFHGIFAPSYNTISQALWIVFTLKFFEWKRCGPVSWGIFPFVMSFAHPISALIISFLILLRFLIEREFRQIGVLLLVLGAGALTSLLVMFCFATPQEYFNSIDFSSGYGIGTAFFSNSAQPIGLMFIYLVFLGCVLFYRRSSALFFSIFTLLCLAAAIGIFSLGFVQGGYSVSVVYMFGSLSAMAYGLVLSSLSATESRLRYGIHWLVVLLLSFATTLALTSSNGLGQSTGAFMVGLPLLLALAARHLSNKVLSLEIPCITLVSILFIVHWSVYPYREDPWWRTSYPIQSVSQFRFINTSLERSGFIHDMQNVLGPFAEKKRALIVSQVPALYFVLNTIAETCMLYMHSITSAKSAKHLGNCLSKKSPELIIDLSSQESPFKAIVRAAFASQEFSCSNFLFRPSELIFSVCKRSADAHDRNVS